MFPRDSSNQQIYKTRIIFRKMEENNLKNLKKDYEKIQKKHSLPSFKEMNEDFFIEKLSETETELLLREVRKMIGDKMMGYVRFIESLLNPMNAPMFVHLIVKLLSQEEKKKLSEIHKELIKKEVQYITLDLNYNEKNEAKFIKESFKLWQDLKGDFMKIIERVNENWESKIESNDRGYFG